MIRLLPRVPAPDRGRRVRHAGLLTTGVLLLASGLPATAQSPRPSGAPEPSAPPPVMTPAPVTTPALTFAPLVTLPPIAPPLAFTPVVLADGYSLGAADAPVTIEVWEDFQCPFCRRWSEQIKPALVDEYIRTGQVRLTYRPLAFLGEELRWAAVAADLAAEQNRFWPFHDLLYANQLGENVGSFSLDRILAMGEAAGLDMTAFMNGLQLEEARGRYARLEADSRVDAAALGIRATPSVVVNGRLLEAPDMDTIGSAVGRALERTEVSPAP